GRVHSFEKQAFAFPFTGNELAWLNSPRLGVLHELRKEPAPNRVQNEMDALLAPLVVDFVPAKAVEDPAFARRHVNGFVAAREQHARIGDDRNVYAKMR